VRCTCPVGSGPPARGASEAASEGGAHARLCPLGSRPLGLEPVLLLPMPEVYRGRRYGWRVRCVRPRV